MRHAVTVAGAFLRRDWQLARSYRFQFVLELLAGLASLAIFFYVGQLVDTGPATPSGVEQSGYFPFVVIGLAFLEMVHAGLASFAQRLREDQATGTLEALLATPTSAAVVVLGSATYDLLRAAVASAGMIALAALVFGFRVDAGPGDFAAVALIVPLVVVLFASLGVAVAAFTVVFKKTTALLGIASAGLALLIGAYFPTSLLPGTLQTASDAFPLTWGLNTLRDALLGGNPWQLQMLGVGLTAIVALPWSLWLFGRAVDRARREGSLAQY